MRHVAECLMTKALIDRRTGRFPLEELEQLFLEALHLCRKACGERHVLMGGITYSLGSTYEYHEEYEKALEYIIKARDTCLQLFGPDHPKTLKVQLRLADKRYASMINMREQCVPETA